MLQQLLTEGWNWLVQLTGSEGLAFMSVVVVVGFVLFVYTYETTYNRKV